MSKLTKRLSELRAKGTRGKWFVKDDTVGVTIHNGNNKDRRQADGSVISKQTIAFIKEVYMDRVERISNAQLIVETINALPKLLEIIRIQGEALEKLRIEMKVAQSTTVDAWDLVHKAQQEVKRIEDENTK